jgi:hypothetical protein
MLTAGPPGDPAGFVPHPPELVLAPPAPEIVPLFVITTPFGNDPDIVNAALPVLVEFIVTPLAIVTISFDVPFHPALVA